LNKKLGPIKPEARIKVALIDDGIDPDYIDGLEEKLAPGGWPWTSETLDDMIGSEQDGDDRLMTFYSSGRHQHGNKMAKLITQACPFVSLYVAKVDIQQQHQLPHPSFKVSEAAKASLILFFSPFGGQSFR